MVQNYPYLITRAIQAALAAPLKKHLRATLAHLVSYVRLSDPAAPIFPHQKTLAEQANCDIRTITRHLTLLEDAGYLVRGEQPHGRNGRFRAITITLTAMALALVGLTEDEVSKRQNVQRQTLTEKNHTKRQPPAARCIQGVPADLHPLVEQGMSKGGVCALMGKATKAGQRLSDIVQVVHHQLTTLPTARRRFGYLRACIASGTDFAWTALQQRQDAIARAGQQADQAAIQAFLARWRNATLASPDGRLRVDLIDGVCCEITRGDAPPAVLSLAQPGMVWDLMTRVASGKLLPLSA